jgi:nucleotide-binding universal stress UspA family protein
MYEKILVPLDGSKRAEMIRPHVRELASRFQATVILIRVIEPTYGDGILNRVDRPLFIVRSRWTE